MTHQTNRWINDDGMAVRFGAGEAVLRNIGAYRTHGPRRFVEILIDAERMGDAADGPPSGPLDAGSDYVNDQFVIPEGAFIESVELVEYEPLDTPVVIGSVDRSDRVSNQLVNGFWSGTAEGPLVGTVLEEDVLVTWAVSTTDPLTEGKAAVRIRWSVPYNAEDTLVWDKSEA